MQISIITYSQLQEKWFWNYLSRVRRGASDERGVSRATSHHTQLVEKDVLWIPTRTTLFPRTMQVPVIS
jgi:hypothetical protein